MEDEYNMWAGDVAESLRRLRYNAIPARDLFPSETN